VNIALRIVQALLAARYGMAGALKSFQTSKTKQQMPWAANRSDAFVRFVGISELLGAAALILPMLTGVLPWFIVTEHLPRKEYNILPINLLLPAFSLFVAFGRWRFSG
jgi:hypothetical protein